MIGLGVSLVVSKCIAVGELFHLIASVEISLSDSC